MFAVIQCFILSSSSFDAKNWREKKKTFELNNDLLIGAESLKQMISEREMILNDPKRFHWRKYYKHHFRSATFVSFLFLFWMIIDLIVLKE